MHDATSGTMLQEYIWIDDMPVAMVVQSGGVSTVSYIHTGQINEPLAVTSGAQALEWNAYVDPYGTATQIGTPTVSLDLRLPGQWRQAETGNLAQNGFRDYDPSLARYVESDPLGIDAGQNLYAYVDGDPLNRIDPSGLECVAGVGCWTTPQEASLANSGNYMGYYRMACADGDAYACFAQHIAANDNFWGQLATSRLLDALRKREKDTNHCIDETKALDQIRKELAKDYAKYLPNSRNNASWPTAEGVAQFHWGEFANFGLPPSTFGGTPFGPAVGPVLPQIWCPNCR